MATLRGRHADRAHARPISSGSTRASAAESPQTETVIPASLPALATPLISASTRGWAASPGPAA